MKQRAEQIIERAQGLAREMFDEPDELARIYAFTAFKTLIDMLREINENWNHDNSYASEKLLGAMEHATALAGLAPEMGLDDGQHYQFVMSDLDSAGSDLALGAMKDR